MNKNLRALYLASGFLVISFLYFSCKKEEQFIHTVRLDLVSSPVTTPILKMCFINPTTGFAVGENGVFLKTVDSGSNWKQVDHFLNSDLDFVDVQFPSDSFGFVLGKHGFGSILYKTNDGGLNWKQCGGRLEMFSFPSSKVGYYITSTNIYKSEDGGDSWESLPSNGGSSLISTFTFINDSVGFITHMSDGMVRTEDGGRTWSDVYTEASISKKYFFTDDLTGFGMGFGQIFKTEDGGKVWYNRIDTRGNDNEFTMEGVDFIGNIGVAVGDFTVSITNDKGNNWLYVYNQFGVNQKENFTSVHMINEKTAVASTASGNFYKITIP